MEAEKPKRRIASLMYKTATMERGYVEWDPYEILNIDRVSVSEHKQRECVPCASTGSNHC